MRQQRSLGSDNNSGAHPDIIKAIEAANVGQFPAYGDDPFTKRAMQQFKAHFGEAIDVHFVFGGTGANVIGLKAATESFNAIICAHTAHINVDECGAPERFIGCKLLPVNACDGKITIEQIQSQLHGIGDQHHIQPKVISISQTTELGTAYSLKELKAIGDFARQNMLYLHMDGSRIANAAAALNTKLSELTKDVGVDILSFGGTKNGMLYGEAIIVFNPELNKNLRFIRKQGMQLPSKMRFIAAQFEALLVDDLWRRNAAHANAMAQRLAAEIRQIPKIRITRPVDANAVFATIPKESIKPLQEQFFFYVWNEESSEVRWMTSFDTTAEDISSFVEAVGKIVR